MGLYDSLRSKFGDLLDNEHVSFYGSDAKQLLGKHLAGPGSLVRLVDDTAVHVSDNFLYVFFTNDCTDIIGYVEFDTNGINEVWSLTDSDVNSIYLQSKYINDEGYEVVTVGYGQEFDREDVESWADEVLNASNVLDILSVRGDYYTSSMCTSDSCCPPEGNLFKSLDDFESVVDVESNEIEINLEELRESLQELFNTLNSVEKNGE
jgi:hypothetical protein